MRCFGTLQPITALEVMVDEISTALSLSIRSSSGGAMLSKPAGERLPATPTPCRSERLRSSTSSKAIRIWQDRAEGEASGREQGSLVGTGVACAANHYAKGADCSLERGRSGFGWEKILIRCNAVEMGNGVGTAVANRVAAILGAIADEVAVAQVDSFGPLGLATSFESFHHQPGGPGRRRRATPRWVPAVQLGNQRFDRRVCRRTHAAAEAAPCALSSVSACGLLHWNCGAWR